MKHLVVGTGSQTYRDKNPGHQQETNYRQLQKIHYCQKHQVPLYEKMWRSARGSTSITSKREWSA